MVNVRLLAAESYISYLDTQMHMARQGFSVTETNQLSTGEFDNLVDLYSNFLSDTERKRSQSSYGFQM